MNSGAPHTRSQLDRHSRYLAPLCFGNLCAKTGVSYEYARFPPSELSVLHEVVNFLSYGYGDEQGHVEYFYVFRIDGTYCWNVDVPEVRRECCHLCL